MVAELGKIEDGVADPSTPIGQPLRQGIPSCAGNDQAID